MTYFKELFYEKNQKFKELKKNELNSNLILFYVYQLNGCA